MLGEGREGNAIASESDRTVALYLGGDNDARKRAKGLAAKANGTVSKPEVATNSIGMKFAAIPAGEFDMGSPPKERDADAQENEQPRHRVKVSALRVGVTEVTVGQFRRFIADTGYKTEAERGDDKEDWSRPGFAQTDANPVVVVSWNDAVAFANWLSRLEGRKEFYKVEGARVTVPDWSVNGYRLPTEAEWEYACRAGTTTRCSCPPGEFDRYAWGAGSEYVTGRSTHAVGEKLPNRFGLHDMHGNAWEWCWDGYDEKAYEKASGPITDPRGPDEARDRVIRGGGIGSLDRAFRSAVRMGDYPTFRGYHIGFRLAATSAE